MSRCGHVYENRVTGEYAIILRGTEDRGAGPGIVYLIARPGAAVVGEHVHPHMWERFTVVQGALQARIDGKLMTLGQGQVTKVEAGIAHDWWNASTSQDAHVLIEIDNISGAKQIDADRFELLIKTLFGLANDGKVDRKGKPRLLQAAVIASEFADVIIFTQPPRAVQIIALGILAPLGRMLGYKAIYEQYAHPHAHITPDPSVLAIAGLR